MKIWTHHYRLRPRRNDSKAVERHGALLLVETDEWRGFADLHPWESFGDRPLDEELERIAAGNPTSLGTRALEIAERDGRARARKEWLFTGATVPASHYLLDSPRTPVDRIVGEGYRKLKLKLDAGWRQDWNDVETLLAGLPDGVFLRLDFNNALTPAEFRGFLATSAPHHRKIDFIEDPCPVLSRWDLLRRPFPVALACDQHVESVVRGGPDVEVLVVKPARHNPVELALLGAALPDRWVVTSYLDHPLGQVAAAWAAAELEHVLPGWVDTCGLVSHHRYEPNAFSERLGDGGPELVPPAGTGLGFDDLLEGLTWTLLGS